MDNKFLELTSSPLMNLDHTYRYSGTKLVEAESLSHHIIDTIMLGLKIIDQINYIAGENLIDTKEYVMKAVYHDLEEVITGDVPRPLKYYNKDTRDSLKLVADEIALRFFNTQFIEGKSHYKIWEDAKEQKEGYVLKLIDTLVVVHKVVKEVSLLHNHYVLRVAHEVSQYLHELQGHISSFGNIEVDEYISEVIDGAIKVVESLLEENKELMIALNIHGQSMI